MNTDKSALHTARWYALKIKQLNTDKKIDSMCEDLIEILSGILQEPAPEQTKPPEPPRVSPSDSAAVLPASGQKSLWYPKAQNPNIPMKARGEYANKYPRGLVVHFTAGRSDKGKQSALDSVSWGASEGYAFLCMDANGLIQQPMPLNEWGYHAGQSSWTIDNKKVTSISQYFVGLEICCAGKLEVKNDKFFSWFDAKTPIAPNLVRVSKAEANIQAGFYLKYTDAQESALIEFCLWLKINNPEVFDFDYVVGHDEISPGRKNDPSGSLSMTMPKLRSLLKSMYASFLIEGKV